MDKPQPDPMTNDAPKPAGAADVHHTPTIAPDTDVPHDDVAQDRQPPSPRADPWETKLAAEPAAPPSDAPPTHFGRYAVTGTLGEGGYGVVYKGFDPELRREVAIKVPRRERTQWVADAEAYLAEARTLASLDHPGIVQVYDFGRADDGLCYVVSKFMPGGDLAAELAAGRPSHQRAVELVIGIAEALHHAHQRGLVHRDIKPGNILLDEARKPLVADFGLALRDEAFGSGSSYCGTPQYMSPEQARGEGHRVDARSDIYSLGVVLYELMTGRRPWRAKGMPELLDEVTSGEIRPPRQLDDTITKELERICLKALAKRAADRYATALDLADDLRHWQDKRKRRRADPFHGYPGVSPLLEEARRGDAGRGHLTGDRLQPAEAAKAAEVVTPKSPTPQEQRLAPVIPKGLRSFDGDDADFFLQLLPGPTDRDGLPDSLRFWKTKIERTDADATFAVGLIYGPSGCGKSSLVKAGLLPRLAEHVRVVYLEATPDDTEARLLKQLRKVCGAGERSGPLAGPVNAPPGGKSAGGELGLVETIAELRRGAGLARGEKLLIVLDQFEQWLHAHGEMAASDLVAALRQCDGARVQCLVMVRDDFWMAASRLLRALEIPLLEGENSAAVDLFDTRHARRVLALFGRALGCVGQAPVGQAFQPDGVGGPADAAASASQAGKPDLQEAFLDQAVAGLAEEGKVVSVRLALFAEMVKGKAWTPATLKEIGGIAGVGVTFLEETFSASTAPPRHRLHQQAARSVLKALLPQAGSDIKGHRRGADELLAAAGYQRRPEEFKKLLRILDAELRLITPTDEGDRLQVTGDSRQEELQGPSDSIRNPQSAIPNFQLTHDYLVPSLRDWLTRKQRETRRGRAELRLAERAPAYAAKRDPRHLPGWWEWPNILLFTARRDWTSGERRLMRAAGRRRLAQAAVALVLLAVLGASAFEVRRRVELGRRRIEAAALVKRLLVAPLDAARGIAAELEPYRDLTDDALRDFESSAEATERERLRAAIGLLPVDPAQGERIYRALLSADPGDARALIDVLAARQADFAARLWRDLTDKQSPATARLPAAAALARFDPQNPLWHQAAPEVAEQLVSVNPAHLGGWRDALAGVAPALVPPLEGIFADPEQGEVPRSLATAVLADYVSGDPQALAGLVARGDAAAFGTLFPVLERHADRAVAELEALVDAKLEPNWGDAALEPDWGEPAAEAVAAVERANGMVTERSAFCAALAWEQFAQLAGQLSASGYRPIRARPYRLTAGLTTAALTTATRPPPATPILVAAVWARDGKRWKLEGDLAAGELPSAEAPAENDGLVPADMAVLPPSDPAAAPRYALLWCQPAQGEERRLVADSSEEDFLAAGSALAQQGFAAQLAVGVWSDQDGQRRYLGIWSNQGPASECLPAYLGFERIDKPQIDLAVAPAAKLPDLLDGYRRQLAEIKKLPAEQSQQPQVRLTRAIAHYHLGALEAALAELDVLARGAPADAGADDTKAPRQQGSAPAVSPLVFQFRAWTLARLGKGEEARAELEKYLQQTSDESARAYARIVLAALLGEFDEAVRELDSVLGELKGAAVAGATSADALYNAACAAALAGQAFSPSDPARAGALFDRAIELVSSAVERGYRNAQQLRSDIDLAALHDEPRFLAIVDQLSPPARVAAVWSRSTQIESRLLGPAAVEDHLRQARELAAQGYRPVAVAGEGDLRAAERPSATAGALVASVWQRPLVPRADRLELARRQAAAMAALARMGQRADVVAALEVDSPSESRGDNPERRTQFVHGAKARGVAAAELLGCIESADRSRQGEAGQERQRADGVLYGLLLALGEFEPAELPPERRDAFVEQLAGWYANDPASGVHGAAGWLLRHWKHDDLVRKVDQTPLAYSPDREWFTLEFKASGGREPPVEPPSSAGTEAQTDSEQTFHITFVVFPPGEYLMGSPLDEPNHAGNEPLHRVTLTRPFALADRELTWEQIAGFDRSIGFDRHAAWEKQFGKKLTADMPAFGVQWYEAVEYCRWLTELAGMSENDQAYADRKTLDAKKFPPDPDPNASGAPKNWPLDLGKPGFRLPTEAEWEAACRCGMNSAYSFGDDRRHLVRYGWFQENSNEWSHAVVEMRPNPRGLFDMHGNLFEWCHDWHGDYSSEAGPDDPLGPADGADRVGRGGCWSFRAANCRTAYRDVNQPSYRRNFLGFRLALVPFSQVETASQAASGSRETE